MSALGGSSDRARPSSTSTASISAEMHQVPLPIQPLAVSRVRGVSEQNTHVACQPNRKAGGNTPTRRMSLVVVCLCEAGVTGKYPDFCAVSDVLWIISHLCLVAGCMKVRIALLYILLCESAVHMYFEG